MVFKSSLFVTPHDFIGCSLFYGTFCYLLVSLNYMLILAGGGSISVFYSIVVYVYIVDRPKKIILD